MAVLPVWLDKRARDLHARAVILTEPTPASPGGAFLLEYDLAPGHAGRVFELHVVDDAFTPIEGGMLVLDRRAAVKFLATLAGALSGRIEGFDVAGVATTTTDALVEPPPTPDVHAHP